MINRHISMAALLAVFCIALTAHAAEKPAAANDACAFPTAPLATQEETAWRIFVAMNCKASSGALTWETWTTQACLNNPSDCKGFGRFHQSQLRNGSGSDDPKRTQGCSPMTVSGDKHLLDPFVPTNLSTKPVFCEEVTVNQPEMDYARPKGLLSANGQTDYLFSQKGTITFPTKAIEVKVDWVPASSFTNAKFDCTKRNGQIYLEEIEGVCYAMASVHISSKLYPNWLWATFEPQYAITNPNRCNLALYNACYDPWGSDPAESDGRNTNTTPALQALFTDAGTALDPAFQNYRLTGTQTEFNQPETSNAMLGNSFTEFNAQVKPQEASCITCHAYAQRDANGNTPGGGAPKGDAKIGTPSILTGHKSLDFSWFLGFGVPTQACQDINAGPIFSNNDAKTKCPAVCAVALRTWKGQWTTTEPGVQSVCGCCL
ncbi:mannan-binding lectin [Ahniella affigens]|nr:mannan-binding lectin [Ahniella affigens]